MAFYNEDDKDKAAEGQSGQQAPTTGQGLTTIGTAGGPSASQDQQANAQSASSGEGSGPSTFAGIQDYVNANKEQTAKLANDVSGLVTGYGNTARDALNTGVNQFNQAVDQNTVN